MRNECRMYMETQTVDVVAERVATIISFDDAGIASMGAHQSHKDALGCQFLGAPGFLNWSGEKNKGADNTCSNRKT